LWPTATSCLFVSSCECFCCTLLLFCLVFGLVFVFWLVFFGLCWLCCLSQVDVGCELRAVLILLKRVGRNFFWLRSLTEFTNLPTATLLLLCGAYSSLIYRVNCGVNFWLGFVETAVTYAKTWVACFLVIYVLVLELF
jgi:hypothetical protein